MFSARLTGAALVAAVSAVCLAASIDLDGDGMADAWELLYGADSLVPGDDDDGDGASNLAEADAGTDPRDHRSTFRFVDFRVLGDSIIASWPTVDGKEYQLERSTDFETWDSEGVWRYGDGGLISLTIAPDQRVFTAGNVVREHYDLATVGGWGLSRLRSSPNYLANTPDDTETLSSLQFLQSVPDQGYFGSRIRAYLIAPATGEYTFHVASDDHSELFLSTNASPANASVIASVPGYTQSNQWDKYPEQHSTPVNLVGGQIYYLLFEHFEGGGGDHGAVAWEGPGISFEIIPGQHLAPYDETKPTLIDPDAHDYFRVKVRDRDTDGDGVADFEEVVLGSNPRSPSSTGGGLNDFDALSASLADTNRVSVATLDTAAFEAESEPGRLQFTREGNLNEFSAAFTLSGSATSADYVPIGTSVHFPVGVRVVTVDVVPILDAVVENDESLQVILLDGADYDVVGSGTASLLIEDARPTLFLARPSPSSGVPTIGNSRILFWEKGNRTSAEITVEFANLTSAHLSTVILLDPSGGGAPVEIATLPAGLVTASQFDYSSAVGASPAEICQAIDEGRLRIELRTGDHPAGELAGALQSQTSDATAFTAPAAPPAPPGGTITEAEAIRFLSQATFGPTEHRVPVVQAIGYEEWIRQHMIPASSALTLHAPALEARAAAELSVSQSHRQAEWFRHAATAVDQLRQRVAFALSEIFVVSDEDGNLGGRPIELAKYYDMLVLNAFGNYRTLLEEVSVSPIMATYLSHLRNPKADPYLGTNPDENYAREIMQLFSIGLVHRHPDGSVIVGPDGVDLPTYDQDTISETARVFTGWSYYTADVENTSFWYGSRDLVSSMSNFPEYHDTGEKTIVGGQVLPAGQTGQQDLTDTLDALFNHPNTGPFLARLLIQRLVTSNPSPGYIYRVASAFNDDGTGTRGNLGAVVKAILLDFEARSDTMIDLPGYGKQHEPLLKFTRLLRLFNAGSPSGTYWLPYEDRNLAQAPLRSPTVFNFFLPDFALPGPIAEAGLVSPELQIIAETTIISATNRLNDFVDENGLMSYDPPNHLSFSWQPYIDRYLIGGAAGLVDFLDLYLCNGQMPADMRTEVIDMIENTNHWDSNRTNEFRVQCAVQVIATSPFASIQR